MMWKLYQNFFAIYTKVSLKCKQGHKRTYFPESGLVVSCPISCDSKTCSLHASINEMFKKETIPDYDCLDCQDKFLPVNLNVLCPCQIY